MTVVGIPPAAPTSPTMAAASSVPFPLPRHRALLPRTPTPYASPSSTSPTPQVLRILQQLGAGGPCRTYQPFLPAQYLHHDLPSSAPAHPGTAPRATNSATSSASASSAMPSPSPSHFHPILTSSLSSSINLRDSSWTQGPPLIAGVSSTSGTESPPPSFGGTSVTAALDDTFAELALPHIENSASYSVEINSNVNGNDLQRPVLQVGIAFANASHLTVNPHNHMSTQRLHHHTFNPSQSSTTTPSTPHSTSHSTTTLHTHQHNTLPTQIHSQIHSTSHLRSTSHIYLHSHTSFSPASLVQLCRCALTAHFTLRGLCGYLRYAGVPRCAARFLCTLAARECIVRSPAPLLDVFSCPFFHRAVTWRVTCALDGQQYVATYACTDPSVVYQECRWLSPTFSGDSAASAGFGSSSDASPWLWCHHPHIMRVWGLVLDDVTGNTFYLLDTPLATLDHIQRRLSLLSLPPPERLVWGVLASVSSAVQHALTHALPLPPPLLPSSVFLLEEAVVLESGLTRKKQLLRCCCGSPSSGASTCLTSSPPSTQHGGEACLVHHLGLIVYALVTCYLRSPEKSNFVSNDLNKEAKFDEEIQQLQSQYSSTLLNMLTCILSGGSAQEQTNVRPAVGAATDCRDGIGQTKELSTKRRNNSKNSDPFSMVLQEPYRELQRRPECSGLETTMQRTYDQMASDRGEHRITSIAMKSEGNVNGDLNFDVSTRPKTRSKDRRLHVEKRQKRCHSSRRNNVDESGDQTLKENVSPNITRSSRKSSKKQNLKLKKGYQNPNLNACDTIESPSNGRPSLDSIVKLAEAEAVRRSGGLSLREVLRACPKQLVELALSGAPH